MEVTSVAIWNRNMVAVVIATIVWTVNSAFLIQGKIPSPDCYRRPSHLADHQVSRG